MSTQLEEQDLLNPAEAARLLRKSTQTILRWIREGHLPGAVRVQSGRSYRYLIPRQDLKALVSPVQPPGGEVEAPPAFDDPATGEVLRRHGLE